MILRSRGRRTDSASGQIQLLVLAPWGVAGGYSGPIVLQDRLLRTLIKKANFSATVLYRDRGLAELPAWVARPVPVVASPAESFPKAAQVKWLLKTSFYIFWNRRRFDAVFLQGTYMLNCLPALFLSQRTRIIALPVVDGGDLTGKPKNIKGLVKKSLQSKLFNRTVLGICLSTGIKNDFVEIGLPGESIRLAYNLVDTRIYCPGAKPTSLDDREFKLLFVGALGRRKQPHLVIEACAELRSSGIDASLSLVGPFEDAEYESHLRQLIERLGLEKFVNIVGMTNHPLPYYQEASVFLLPSRSEGMPGALSEAMACGVPVVVSPIGAMPEVVESAQCGFVVKEFDSELWARVLEEMYRKPGLMQKMSAGGRRFAEYHMTPDALAIDIRRFVSAERPQPH
ncbi:glycosyltransferase [Kocuria kalidii]|uniref:glycosyltransferase family 4 protein n=1 Tax=Kocuria kalidii TaxID=3376283 RepID=UPI0037B2821B